MSVTLKVKPSLGFDGAKARQLRLARNESIPAAAARMGISYWGLYHIEHGRPPSLDMLLVLAEGYGVEPGELLSKRDEAA